jgi:catechol 2,3-dioxygenase-like lactoylglutathione lyase family enzyme
MSSKQLSNDAARAASKAAAVPMRLEAVVVPVADVERANRFYQRLGWRVDADVSADDDYSRGVDVSEEFHDAGGGLGGGFVADTEARAAGPDPQGRSYATYASFSDPDGNRWLLQEITERLPGRV